MINMLLDALLPKMSPLKESSTAATTSSIKKYIGLTANTFKSRFYQHKNSFRDPTK